MYILHTYFQDICFITAILTIADSSVTRGQAEAIVSFGTPCMEPIIFLRDAVLLRRIQYTKRTVFVVAL